GYPSLGTGWHGNGVYTFDSGATVPVGPTAVTATNNAGLASAGAPFSAVADGTAPATTISCNGGSCGTGWYSSSVSVSLAASDAQSGVGGTSYSVNGGATQTYSGAISVSSTSTISFYSTDKVGNVEATQTKTIQVDTTAPTAPALTLTAGTNSSVTGSTVFYNPAAAGGFTVGASSTDAESGVASYGFPSLGSGWSNTGGSYSFAAAATDPPEPNNVTATNNAGLTSPATGFTVSADGSAPTTSVQCNGAACAAGFYGSAVSVSLAASDAGSGVAQTRYTTDGSDPSPVNGTVYTGAFSVAATTTVKFRSYDKVANEEAVGSVLVQIDANTPSAPLLTLSETSPYESTSGSTLYYNPTSPNSGSFDLGATSSASSGISKITFPAISGLTGGGDDTTSPYSTTYSWSASATAAGSQPVTATSGSGRTNSSTFVLQPDPAGPHGGSVSYTDGYNTTGTVSVSTADGVDDLAGIDTSSRLLERQTATLSGGSCGSFGAWATVTSPDTLASGLCAQYRYTVKDNVGNKTVYTSTNTVKVDKTAAGAPGLTFSSLTKAVATGSTVFYNANAAGGFTVGASSTDAESGVTGFSFPTFGSGWSNTGGVYAFG